MNLPTNTPSSFGDPVITDDGVMTVIDTATDAPAPREGDRPVIRRLASCERGNLIVGTFLPGQSLADHKAAHPITVQATSGTLLFTCRGTTVELSPGVVLHLPKMIVHRVDCPADSGEPAVMLLTMLTPDAQS